MLSKVTQIAGGFTVQQHLTIEVVLFVLALIFFICKIKWKSSYEHLHKQQEEDKRNGMDEISRTNRFIDEKKAAAQEELSKIEGEIKAKSEELADLILQAGDRSEVMIKMNEDSEKVEESLSKLNKRYEKSKYIMDSFAEALTSYAKGTLLNPEDYLAEYEQLKENLDIDSDLEIQALSIKELRLKYRNIKSQIKDLYDSYISAYDNKSDLIIYKLFVSVVEEGVKNIFSTMRYGKLDTAIDKFRVLTGKCFKIAITGNENVVAPLSRFIGQLEYLYILAIKTEYEYYIKQEQAKEEQREIKEKMQQEAMERRILNEQRKQVESEEKKYQNEIDRLQSKLSSSHESDEVLALKQRIKEVEELLKKVSGKKEEIVNLQHGKAGTIYIISNIGSFGENVFKIGMTRRLEPMERIYELSSASVPFPFDVHSMIFSEDAAALENSLHKKLFDKRVNKVNPRKEFFKIPIDEIESIVNEIDPSAPFHRTILAEQFNQSQSIVG